MNIFIIIYMEFNVSPQVNPQTQVWNPKINFECLVFTRLQVFSTKSSGIRWKKKSTENLSWKKVTADENM